MKSKVILIFVVMLAACMPQFASDIYSPSLPAIAKYMGTSFNLVKLTMPIFMFSTAFSQLVYGPLSEGFGRKKILLLGIAIFIIGTINCLMAKNINALLLGRFIQGLGIGSASVLFRAILRDVFSGEQLAKIGSYIAVTFTWITAAAPMIGGFLQQHYGWHSNFIFLFVYTIVVLIAVIFLYHETSQHHHIDRLKLKFIASTYWGMLSDRFFIGMVLCSFLAFGGIFSFATASPIIIIHEAHIPPDIFGIVFGLGGGVASICSSMINIRYVNRVGGHNMIKVGIYSILIAGLLMGLSYLCFGLHAWMVFLFSFIYMFGAMLVFPNIFSLAFTPYGKIAGYAGALYGGIQVLGGAVLGALISYVPDKTPIPISIIYIFIGLLIALCYFWGRKAAQSQGQIQ